MIELVCALWLAAFGVWPLADPGHDPRDGWLPIVDLALHAWGIVYVARAWMGRAA